MKQNESMDSRNEFMFLQISYTIPTSLQKCNNTKKKLRYWALITTTLPPKTHLSHDKVLFINKR
jgi:hypothetical protein